MTTSDGIEISERFGQITHDLLYAILRKLIALENCMCGGGQSNTIRVPIYDTYVLPAGARLLKVTFPDYGNISDQFTYHAFLGTTSGGNEIAEEYITTFNPREVTVNLPPFGSATTLYYQNNLATYDSAQAVAWLEIEIP